MKKAYCVTSVNNCCLAASSRSSFNRYIAGKVTAVKAGTATITVTTADGGKTATCVVTVSATELIFRYNAAYDIPAMTVNEAIVNIYASTGASGGTAFYTFTVTGFPAGITSARQT